VLTGLGLRAVGLDAFPTFLEEARGRGFAGPLVAGSAERLPFADKSFDTTVIFSVLEHVDDAAALAEAVRVTRRRILAQVPLADEPEVIRNGFVFVHHRDRTHLREYSAADLRDLFERAGCRVVAVRPAYPANVRGLLADSVRLPGPFRFLVRALLRPFKFAFAPHHTEAFLVAEPRDRR